jgi:hypothetical protein
MFGIPPKIGLTSSLLPANMIEKLKTEELKVALESIQVLSNDNENNEIIGEEDDEQIIENKTKIRQTSINQNRKESLNNLKITNKCKFRKTDRLCNSKCHASKSCANK